MSEKIEIGAMWRKTSERTGSQYYTGDLALPGGEKVKIIAFDVDRKTKETQPDIRIYLQEDRSGGSSPAPRSETYSSRPPASRPAPAARTASPSPAPEDPGFKYPEEEIDPADIPF